MSTARLPHPDRPALGHAVLDRRAELRARGWDALAGLPRRTMLLDGAAEAAVVRTSAGAHLHVDPDGPARPAGPTVPAGPGAPADVDPPGGGAVELFLGVDPQGVAVVARVAPRPGAMPAEVTWEGLRRAGLALPDVDREALAEAVALANWHASHPRCPRCGSPTVPEGLGWWRTCPRDGSTHFPRTDPAVIALLVDAGGNALLGRQGRWPSGAFSTLAGFVEPGESAEAAVVREIREEVGLTPDSSTYVASQPWPFPASLMLGYHARIAGDRPEPTVDGEEIVEARWVSRAELAQLCESEAVRLPGRLSIAHHLVTLWFGQRLPDSWCRW